MAVLEAYCQELSENFPLFVASSLSLWNNQKIGSGEVLSYTMQLKFFTSKNVFKSCLSRCQGAHFEFDKSKCGDNGFMCPPAPFALMHTSHVSQRLTIYGRR